ncbi:MAG TPA: hypothetical protein VGD37_34400 [Kofleriaceae bacterium]
MILLRLLTTALCVTCVVLIATFPPMRIVVMPPAAAPPIARPSAALPAAAAAAACDRGAPLSVIDVAEGIAPSQLAALIPLRPDEHVIAVNDRVVTGDLEAGAVIAARAPLRGGFVDLTVSSPSGERRVLILLHGPPL